MSIWSVKFTRQGQRDIDRLDHDVKQRIAAKLRWLSEHLGIVSPIPLTGNFRDFYKLRAGDWRVVYSLDLTDRQIIVEYIDNRDSIYKRR